MGTTGLSITLANSIIGVGILAMPFCFQQCGLLLASVILLSMGLISRLCCYFLLKSAILARRRNFEFLAFHVFGSAGKMAVEVGIIGFLMGTCIAYFVVVGDLGPQIVAKMFNINQSDILRTSIMVIVSLVCVLPLGLLRNVDSLSNVSAATIGFYFILVMKLITEAASQLLSWDWHRRVELWRPAGLLQCVPIFSMALFCQTQLFEIFESLPTLSLEKMNVVTKNAINICTGVYFTLGVFGYIAFCSQDISGNILMSLSPTMASDVIKLGFVMSLAFSFPLIIFPCRASLYSFLYKKVHSSHHDHIINHSIPETTFRCITVVIIAVALFISLLIPNIELVLGLVGSTIGVLICVVFPAACFVNVTFKNTNERLLAKGILVLGLIIMVLGTYANLEAAGDSSKVDRYDDKYTQENIDKIVEDFFEKRQNDVYLKPQKLDSKVIDKHKSVIDKEIAKDSEVQPPNPVPPESQSNEKPQELETVKSEEKKIIARPPIQETIDKVSESHPKNLKTKLETQMSNGVGKIEIKQQREIKPQSSEDKIDMLKQQKLIETIKQHGEEQKELMKEQKEILDEIIKTKKEIEKDKNDADTDAKKIAVESIKQIASMAIQSIGGASEKPVQVNDKKAEMLQELTNEAVQEIAKKAVETIEAIQEIKEPKESVQNIVLQPKPIQSQNAPQPPKIQPLPNPQSVQSEPKQQNIQERAVNMPSQSLPVAQQIIQQPPQTGQQPIQNLQQPPQNVQQPVPNVQPQVEKVAPQVAVPQNIQPQANPQIPVANLIVDKQNAANFNPPAQHNGVPVAAPSNVPVMKENIAQIPKVQEPQHIKPPTEVKREVKPHSHSPDEPQSYKQGEDTQDKVVDPKPQNVPLAIAMNDLLSSKQIQEKEAVGEQLNDDIKVPIKVQDIIRPSVVRQKREVVDCTQKISLEKKDKEICDTLIDRPKDLPPIDMNEVALPKSLPMDANVINYVGRSLKSFDKDER